MFKEVTAVSNIVRKIIDNLSSNQKKVYRRSYWDFHSSSVGYWFGGH
jgi:hypothetical protein